MIADREEEQRGKRDRERAITVEETGRKLIDKVMEMSTMETLQCNNIDKTSR